MTVIPDFPKEALRSSTRKVLPEWIDYNGHMNVAYYTLAIDQLMDEMFDELGVGVALVKTHQMGPMALVNQVHFLDELLEGEEFYIELQLLDSDHKRMHYFVTMINAAEGTPAATYEGLSMNVDLKARKSAPYPAEALTKIEALTAAHADLPAPPQAGADIGIRRKG
ncbi:MAG: thioesterase family protein [Pseudomonadota bacterium]